MDTQEGGQACTSVKVEASVRPNEGEKRTPNDVRFWWNETARPSPYTGLNAGWRGRRARAQEDVQEGPLMSVGEGDGASEQLRRCS